MNEKVKRNFPYQVCLIKYLLKACEASTWTNIYLQLAFYYTKIKFKMEAFDGFVSVNLMERSLKMKPHPFIIALFIFYE